MFAINNAAANPLARADAAFARGDYVRAVNILTPLAFGGDARAQALLGFMFEHGYGAPQVITRRRVCTVRRRCGAIRSGKPCSA